MQSRSCGEGKVCHHPSSSNPYFIFADKHHACTRVSGDDMALAQTDGAYTEAPTADLRCTCTEPGVGGMFICNNNVYYACNPNAHAYDNSRCMQPSSSSSTTPNTFLYGEKSDACILPEPDLPCACVDTDGSTGRVSCMDDDELLSSFLCEDKDDVCVQPSGYSETFAPFAYKDLATACGPPSTTAAAAARNKNVATLDSRQLLVRGSKPTHANSSMEDFGHELVRIGSESAKAVPMPGAVDLFLSMDFKTLQTLRLFVRETLRRETELRATSRSRHVTKDNMTVQARFAKDGYDVGAVADAVIEVLYDKGQLNSTISSLAQANAADKLAVVNRTGQVTALGFGDAWNVLKNAAQTVIDTVTDNIDWLHDTLTGDGALKSFLGCISEGDGGDQSILSSITNTANSAYNAMQNMMRSFRNGGISAFATGWLESRGEGMMESALDGVGAGG